MALGAKILDHMHNDYSFTFSHERRRRFREGMLVREWWDRHPNLFDEDDERVTETPQQRQYHFLEWLAAILLYESTGYYSLVEKRTAKSHPKKRSRLRECVPQKLVDWLYTNVVGQPDLFVYVPDSRDWYFCEVKGPSDRIKQNQLDLKLCFELFLQEEDIAKTKCFRVLSLCETVSNAVLHPTAIPQLRCVLSAGDLGRWASLRVRA